MKLNKKKIIFILLLIAICLPVGITFSRYVGDFIYDFILKANNFYFRSDKLEEGNPTYNINNWSGVNSFEIQFELNNRQNSLLSSDTDVTYVTSVECSDDVLCTLSNTGGTIYKSQGKVDINLTIHPERIFDTDEEIQVVLTASSTAPYKKTLKGTFNVKVGKKGISYEIKDDGNKYFLFSITNALDQYTVKEAFGSHLVGDILSIDEYKLLSDDNKTKCKSAIITLSFNPQEVIVDPTSSVMSHATYTTGVYDGINYINSITFDVEATSSNEVRFYKIDSTKNYKWPFSEHDLVVNFNAEI